MIKKLLVLLAVLAALWGIPATRSRMVAVSEPVLARLGPVGETVARPARRYNAKTACALYLRLIAEGYNEGREPPTPRDFPRWARAKTEREPVDPWGNRYWLQRDRGTLTVGSNGPDGRRGNADDIKQTVPF